MVVAVPFLATATRDRPGGARPNLLYFIAFPRPARAMDDAAARLSHHRAVLIRTCGDHPAPARAKIILDLWLMSLGPFSEAVGAAIFWGDVDPRSCFFSS